jgi:hypothetical protein
LHEERVASWAVSCREPNTISTSAAGPADATKGAFAGTGVTDATADIIAAFGRNWRAFSPSLA